MLELKGNYGYTNKRHKFIAESVSDLWNQLIDKKLVSEEDYDRVLEKKYNLKFDNMTDEEINEVFSNKDLTDVEWLDLIVERCYGNMNGIRIIFDCHNCECATTVNGNIFDIEDCDFEKTIITDNETHRIELLNKLLNDECPICDHWEI